MELKSSFNFQNYDVGSLGGSSRGFEMVNTEKG